MICYDRYCKNYDRAIEVYQQMVEDPGFVSMVEAQRLKWAMRIGGLLLTDFLIKPVQRICKYPLLFKALIGYTAENHSDMPLLQKADKAVNQAAEAVNRARADQKSAQDMKTIDENMEGYTGGTLCIPGRFLVRAGPLVKLSPSGAKQDRHFFLFTDMILYAKKNKSTYHYKDHIELVELQVRLPDKAPKGLSAKETELCFELVRQDAKKKKTYAILADTVEHRKGWVTSLTDTIATANRRKQTVSEDAINQLEARMRHRGVTSAETAAASSGRTFSLFSTARGGKSPRANTLTSDEAPEVPYVDGGSDMAVLNAVKTIRAQVADTTKLLAQAQELQAKLSEKVEVMQRMVDLEAKARTELQERIEALEGKGGGGGGGGSSAAVAVPARKLPAKALPESIEEVVSASPSSPSKPLPVLNRQASMGEFRNQAPKSPVVPAKMSSTKTSTGITRSPSPAPRPPVKTSPAPPKKPLPSKMAKKPVEVDEMANTPPMEGYLGEGGDQGGAEGLDGYAEEETYA